jgi:hypothetical protein
MFKWSTPALLFVLLPILAGQWAPAPAPQANYPQSQYPDNAQQPPPNQPQQSQQTPENPDPADLQHGVARLSIVQGDVNIQRGDTGQLSGAITNAPLVAHDHVQTSGGSRAEVQLDAGTLLRLSPNTDLGFADLQYHRAQVQLGLGTIIFRVMPNAQSQVEIDTPSVGIHALAPGEYRISVFDNGTSEVTARSGQLELSGPRGSERVDAGRSVMVRGDAADPEMQTLSEIYRDQFDQWSEDRDRQFAGPQSARYVNADVQGAADLDQYGNWVPSGYGQVWRPQDVASDWSPYSNGQWSYVDYYGWSWIDYSPWGWAPYHYGRWFWNTGYGWCWWPGAIGLHAYWSPALVGFFGFGRAGIGIGFGGLGWVALAPFELFHPWWGRGYGLGFRTGYRIASYRNATIRGGAMTAPYNGFGVAHQRFAAATRGEIQGATSFSGRLPLSATRGSMNFSGRQPVANSHLAVAQSRSFFHQSSPQSRSFAASSVSSYSNARSYSSSGAGWRAFGAPSTSGSVTGYRSNQSPESGWHHFGQPQPGANSYQANRNSSPGYSSAGQQHYGYQSSAPHQSYSQQQAPRTQPQPRSSGNNRSSEPRESRGGGGGGHAESHSSGGGGGHHHR